MTPTPAQSDETPTVAPPDNMCEHWQYKEPHHWIYHSKYGVSVGICQFCYQPNLKELQYDFAAERQRIYAAVEEAIDKSRQTRKVISPKMISIYEEEFVTTAELRAAIKRLREGA